MVGAGSGPARGAFCGTLQYDGRLRTLVYDSEASLYRERHADGQAHTRAELFAELAQDDVITFYGLQAPETRDR